MVEEMASLLENFPGAANQTRCFLHILNLTAKSILQQFEIPKKKKAGDGDGDGNDDKKLLSKAMNELLALSDEIEDELTGVDDEVDDGNDSDADLEDDEEGLEDERKDLSAEQIAELEADLLPVRLMLTKV
jgi:archaellum component FlaC